MGEAETRQLIETVSKTNRFKKQVRAFLPILSLLVVLGVFWWLKTTAITLAGDAFCGMEEHKHSEECEKTLCQLEEHIHKATCYSDMQADLEAKETWEETFKGVPQNIPAYEKLVLIAKTQKGYLESERNFIISETGERLGCTRYGQWYGNPYGEWSTMFTSFCLYYSGIDVPLSSGADAMRLQWKEKGIYQPSNKYSPILGDIVFFDRNQNGQADSTGIVVSFSQAEIVVIEGDFENEVKENVYSLSDSSISGYGLVSPKNSLTIIENSSDIGVDILGAGESFAKTVTYNQNLFTSTNLFVLYTQSGSNYYAFDGNGNAVRIYIDSNGNITTDSANTDSLLWTFTYSSSNTYYIQNVSTGRYMHAHSGGVTTSGRYTSVLVNSGSGVKVRSNSEYAMLNGSSFVMTRNQGSAATYYFGMTSRCTVWLDGTNGHLMGIDGSLDKSYSVSVGDVLKLPEEWQTPTKYNYVLKGWYDITNSKYYAPGEEVTVTGNTVFYADWVAGTYDIGEYNSHVVNTISTNDFITTRVFDYGYLFDVMSLNPTINVDSSGHSETWNLVTSGIVAYENKNTLNYIFRDWDSNGKFSYPRNTNNINTNGTVYPGLYYDALGDMLFNPNTSYDPNSKTGIIGKNYLGTADHLFQVMEDSTNPNYGYYYYDSALNAASYNQSDERFYVYDYLERTTDSAKSSGDGSYSDFLPFNSPYANGNGNDVRTYTYNGLYGEHAGNIHYMYDAKYNTEDNSTSNVGTNFLFGMSIDIDFYLPNSPGEVDANGEYGNKDLYGKDMHFKFSGDDDVWVLIDGKLVLDIGGIHGIESGDINFSTGVVMVNGTQTGTITDLTEGEHTLTFYYLERGSSQSNCAIYFNLAPRFSFSIQKEDVLTKDVLNGAEFSVYTDKACTIPASLWGSEASYENGDEPTNVFTVKNGEANMWGMSAGNTYYIKETAPPIMEGYGYAHGIICVSIDKRGQASYSVSLMEEDGIISSGFTVHGFRIDEETQKAYIVATNAPSWVNDTTTVKALKKWDDNLDHTADSVTVYLTVTDKDGTVRRLQEIELSEENDWTHNWTNLPKYYEDGTEIIYGVEEAYKSGYYSKIEKVDRIVVSQEAWSSSSGFQNGKVYILNTSSGYLSSAGESSGGFIYVTESVAKSSPLARWKATVSGNTVKLTNEAGQIITCQYNGNGTYFYLTYSNTNYQNLTVSSSNSGMSLSLYYNNSHYYWGGLNSNGTGSHTGWGPGAMFITLTERTSEEKIEQITGFAYEITNVPLEVETSVKVTKLWDLGMSTEADYLKAQVTIKLFANGKDTGRSVTLSLKNNWSDSFLGLPYTDEAGNVIVYSIKESWDTEDWDPVYGEVVTINDGDVPRYETTVTNYYIHGRGFELPSTGSYGYLMCIWGGFAIMLLALCLAVTSRLISYRKIKK
ncbi:MAG: Cna B-type domain-containing protein [Ruminococcaceae bacterium]|nr:Cna B-type domain-containing protein [Oscillospiraceae bacterium]